MDLNFLDFEQPIAELEAKIEELRLVGDDNEINIQDEITRLEGKSRQLTASIFSNLTPWQISQVARHPLRPYLLDYIPRIFTDFEELHGDRAFADDHAIVGGVARLDGRAVMLIGQQKGRDTKEKLHRNFGMPRPEGYRKALRLMKLAERFQLPASMPRSAGRARRSRATCSRWRASRPRSSPPSSARVGRAARSRSEWRTAWSCCSTRPTR